MVSARVLTAAQMSSGSTGKLLSLTTILVHATPLPGVQGASSLILQPWGAQDPSSYGLPPEWLVAGTSGCLSRAELFCLAPATTYSWRTTGCVTPNNVKVATSSP